MTQMHVKRCLCVCLKVRFLRRIRREPAKIKQKHKMLGVFKRKLSRKPENLPFLHCFGRNSFKLPTYHHIVTFWKILKKSIFYHHIVITIWWSDTVQWLKGFVQSLSIDFFFIKKKFQNFFSKLLKIAFPRLLENFFLRLNFSRFFFSLHYIVDVIT